MSRSNIKVDKIGVTVALIILTFKISNVTLLILSVAESMKRVMANLTLKEKIVDHGRLNNVY